MTEVTILLEEYNKMHEALIFMNMLKKAYHSKKISNIYFKDDLLESVFGLKEEEAPDAE